MRSISDSAICSRALVREERVRHEDVHLGRAVLLQRPRTRDQRPAGGGDVVADDRPLAAHLAGDLGHLHLVGGDPHLVHDREARLDHLGETDGVLGAAGIGRHGDDVLTGEPEVAEVRREELQCRHVVDRDREEALDLAGVEVHRQDAVDTRELEHVRDETGGDRLTWFRLPVLPRVREPRDHGRDPLRGRQLRRLDHQHELHQVLVHGRGTGLDDEDVGAPDRLQVAAVRLVVRERTELDIAELDAQFLGHRVRELRMRAAGKDHQPLLRPAHDVVLGLRVAHGDTAFQARKGQLSRRRAFHASRRPTLPSLSAAGETRPAIREGHHP